MKDDNHTDSDKLKLNFWIRFFAGIGALVVVGLVVLLFLGELDVLFEFLIYFFGGLQILFFK